MKLWRKMALCSHIWQPFWKMVTPGTVEIVKNHLKLIPHVQKHIFRPKNNDIVTIFSENITKNSWFYANYCEVIAKNSFWQPFLAAILNNGDSWNCWGSQHHLKWICYVHKHALRPKNHDIMIIISEIMAKNVILQPYWQPFWKMVTHGTVGIVKTILN